jgi:hypothetical protein
MPTHVFFREIGTTLPFVDRELRLSGDSIALFGDLAEISQPLMHWSIAIENPRALAILKKSVVDLAQITSHELTVHRDGSVLRL